MSWARSSLTLSLLLLLTALLAPPGWLGPSHAAAQQVGPEQVGPLQTDTSSVAVDARSLSWRVADEIRDRLGGSPAGEHLRAGPWLEEFYAARSYRPAWSREGVPTATVDSLLGAIRLSELEGLRPVDYHQAALVSLLVRVRYQPRPDPRDLADLDILASDAFLLYGSHLLSGVVDPVTLDRTWVGGRQEQDLPGRLIEVLEHGRVQESFRELLFTSHPGYLRLRSALARYRTIEAEGGWPTVPDADTLWPGDRADAVAILRARLVSGGDLAPASRQGTGPAREASTEAFDFDPFHYDEALEQAVRRFQRRHGLQEDGVAGPATLRALNVPAAERLRTIELNMERWRWLPQDLGSRYVLVNIAAFRVEVFEGVEPVLRMRAIVGREYQQTPAFSDTMTYLVLNPSWNVPRGLAVREKLPQFREDPGAIRRLGYRLFESWDAGAAEVEPDTIDWSSMTADRFRDFRLWQAPGPQNALGQVKFMFPNQFDVYLHDTPERQLFGRLLRDVSSGCIRVEEPLQLAEYLLRGKEGWSRERIERVVGGETETTVVLPDPLPIHLQYWTAWTEPDGTVHFRGDVYGRDGDLGRALSRAEPGIPAGRFR